MAAARAAAGATHDVVVVGGGMIGASLALALRRAPALASTQLRVALVEARGPPPDSTDGGRDDTAGGGHNPHEAPPQARTVALAAAARDLVEAIGVWNGSLADRATPLRAMRVWDGAGFGSISFGSEGGGGTAMGALVENAELEKALMRTCMDPATGIDLFAPASVARLEFDDGKQWAGDSQPTTIHLNDGTSLRARLVVGADGPGSRIRSLAGIPYASRDYNQHGVVAAVKTLAAGSAGSGLAGTAAAVDQKDAVGRNGGDDAMSRTTATTAYQRFLPTGPVALLPSLPGYMTVVWSTTPARARALVAADDDAFVAALNGALLKPNGGLPPGTSMASSELGTGAGRWDQLGGGRSAAGMMSTLAHRFGTPWAHYLSNASGSGPPTVPHIASVEPGSRAKFPLKFAHAASYVGPRLALVGDAAHSMHVLAGQGANAGFGDVIGLANTVAEAVGAGHDPGDSMFLERYARARRAENTAMMYGVDALAHLFGTDNPALAVLRSVGMSATNAMAPLKDLLMHQAMGTDQRLAPSRNGGRPRAGHLL